MKSRRPSAEKGGFFPALALETSTRPGSAAIALSEREVFFTEISGGGDLSSHLVPALDELRRRAGLDPDEIRLTVLGTGPGSFTGLRSGAAAAAVLSAYIPAPLAAVPSLEGCPLLSRHPSLALCLDALRGDVQGQIFREGEPTGPPFLASPRDFAARLEGEGFLAGSAAARLKEEGLLPPGWTLLEGEDWTPRADHLLRRGILYAERGRLADPAGIEILYLRPSAAAERRRKDSAR